MALVVSRVALAALVLAMASASRSVLRRREGQTLGPSDEYEYGDKESHESSADSSDFSMHQFLAADDGRDGASGGDGAEEMAKAKALAAADHFDSEDTPDPDAFAQTGRKQQRVQRRQAKAGQMPFGGDEYEYGDKESHESSADSSDFSMHQFLAEDDARDGASRAGDSSGATEMAAAKALAAEDHFASEDTPDPDSFAQTGRKQRRTRRSPGDDDDDQTGYEYGDRQANARNEDSSDFSVHQFLARDDGREGSDTSKDADGGAAAEKARSKALRAQTHFDSEDTPDK